MDIPGILFQSCGTESQIIYSEVTDRLEKPISEIDGMKYRLFRTSISDPISVLRPHRLSSRSSHENLWFSDSEAFGCPFHQIRKLVAASNQYSGSLRSHSDSFASDSKTICEVELIASKLSRS
jgi:hypothetical protein